MKRRSRKRRVLKWMGTVACVLLLGLWWVSWRPGDWWTWYYFRDRGMVVSFGLSTGYYCCELQRDALGLLSFPASGHPAMGVHMLRRLPRWMYLRPFEWRHSPVLAYDSAGTGVGEAWSLFIAAWVPAALLAIPTALLWYLDRRRIVPGHCQKCGYDLTGNVSGRCPECGAAIEREGKPA